VRSNPVDAERWITQTTAFLVSVGRAVPGIDPLDPDLAELVDAIELLRSKLPRRPLRPPQPKFIDNADWEVRPDAE
jgi:hypothetical protein